MQTDTRKLRAKQQAPRWKRSHFRKLIKCERLRSVGVMGFQQLSETGFVFRNWIANLVSVQTLKTKSITMISSSNSNSKSIPKYTYLNISSANTAFSFWQQNSTMEFNSEKMKSLISLNTDQKKGGAAGCYQIIRGGADELLTPVNTSCNPVSLSEDILSSVSLIQPHWQHTEQLS